MMTTPASAIKDEVRLLIDIQIETFRQPTPLTNSQLREYHPGVVIMGTSNEILANNESER